MNKRTENQVELNRRSRAILKELVRQFIRTGKPVGSQHLADTYDEKLSPATVRSVVAELERMGFVMQPHTSAGRVPTSRGYQFFVEGLSPACRLSDRQIDRIRHSLEGERTPEALMARASRVLSVFSDNVGFVLVPPMSRMVIRQIEFVRISPGRILVIVVAKNGSVQNKIIEIEEDLTQQDLDQASRYLVENYQGRTLVEMREDLVRLASHEKVLYDRMLKVAVLLGCRSLMNDASPEEDAAVYLDGTSHILEKTELAESQMIAIFKAFEEKDRLIRILTECVRQGETGPTVTIGLEKHFPGMKNFALVSAPYIYDTEITGNLGILGPSRMQYEKAMGLVDCVARLFGNLLSETQQLN